MSADYPDDIAKDPAWEGFLRFLAKQIAERHMAELRAKREKDREKPKERPIQADDASRLLTPAQLSERLGIAKQTVYQWVHQGYLPHVKLGTLLRFDPKQIHEWIKKRSVKGRTARWPKIDL